ncbi:MAG: glycerophosphoryl diester phosphodiesterase [Pseudomonadota bacterium]
MAGHRGAKGTAPENTIASFMRAAELGVRFVELDVNLAGSGEIVVFHDYTLDRCTNGSGALRTTHYSVLETLDAGSHFSGQFLGEKIPLFRELIPLLDEFGMGVNVEIKSQTGNEKETVDHTIDILRKHWPRNMPLLLSSFNESVMQRIAEVAGEFSRGWLVEDVPDNWQRKLQEFGAVSLHAEDEPLQKHQVDAIHAQGYPVLVYTVNKRDRAEELLEWGVACVISDFPERLQGV